MKKTLSLFFVILFSFLGANAFAEKFDINVKNNTKETSDSAGGSNGSGVRNSISKD